MKQNPPTLTPRLETVAALIQPCVTVADIGADHAYLPVYLCMNKICKSAIASDIRRGPLMRAQSVINKYNAGDMVKTRLGAGAEVLGVNEANCIVIAGMGGQVISEIIQNSAEIFSSAEQIILQPMTAADELRRFLNTHDYTIAQECLAKEGDKIYNIISVKCGTEPKYTETEFYLGKCLIKSRPEYFNEYCAKRRRRLEKMIGGLKLSSCIGAEAELKRLDTVLDDINNIQGDCKPC